MIYVEVQGGLARCQRFDSDSRLFQQVRTPATMMAESAWNELLGSSHFPMSDEDDDMVKELGVHMHELMQYQKSLRLIEQPKWGKVCLFPARKQEPNGVIAEFTGCLDKVARPMIAVANPAPNITP